MSLRSIEFATLADSDLDLIAAYSERMWGRDRVVKYLHRLGEQIEVLAHFPERGLLVGGQYGSLRKMIVGRHIVYYTFDDIVVFVIRILHERLRHPQGLI